MSAYLNAAKALDRSSEIYAGTYVCLSAHGCIGSTVAGIGCPVFSKRQSKPSASDRRKLLVLIYDSDDRIGIY